MPGPLGKLDGMKIFEEFIQEHGLELDSETARKSLLECADRHPLFSYDYISAVVGEEELFSADFGGREDFNEHIAKRIVDNLIEDTGFLDSCFDRLFTLIADQVFSPGANRAASVAVAGDLRRVIEVWVETDLREDLIELALNRI